MAKIAASLDVNRPVDQVFAYWTDLKHWRDWDSSIENAELEAGPVHVGSKLKGTSVSRGRSRPFTGEVTEYQPNRTFAYTVRNALGNAFERDTFVVSGTGTHLEAVLDLKPKGWLIVLTPLIVRAWRKKGKNDFAKLRANLEKH